MGTRSSLAPSESLDRRLLLGSLHPRPLRLRDLHLPADHCPGHLGTVNWLSGDHLAWFHQQSQMKIVGIPIKKQLQGDQLVTAHLFNHSKIHAQSKSMFHPHKKSSEVWTKYLTLHSTFPNFMHHLLFSTLQPPKSLLPSGTQTWLAGNSTIFP